MWEAGSFKAVCIFSLVLRGEGMIKLSCIWVIVLIIPQDPLQVLSTLVHAFS